MNNFELIAKLGEGTYSIVYKVRRKADLKIYALKKVKLKNLSEKEKQNALNEVRILASIKSDHVISYKEAFIEEKEKILNLVMEFANKGDLFQKITYYKQMQKSFEEIEIWKIFIQMVQGLKSLHDLNILHRDLKSANIFLFNNGLAKIGDLNVSKVAKKGLGYTQTGTPYYASPEIWNDEPYSNKSDIWSLGCVIYEMMTLHPPFRAESMEGLYHKIIKGKYPKIPDKYSSDLNEILKLLLKVDPKDRPSCSEILKNPIVTRRIEFLEENKNENNNDVINPKDESSLLKTINVSKNLLFLSGRLPKANYGSSPHKMSNNINKSENSKQLLKNITSLNNDNILPSINNINYRYNNRIKNLPNLKKSINHLNLFTDPENQKREISIKNRIKGLNIKLPTSPYKLQTNENKSNNVIKSQRNKKVIISNLLGKNMNNIGLNNLYKIYVSKDYAPTIDSPGKKYDFYLPKVYNMKNVKEKRANSNSEIGSKLPK